MNWFYQCAGISLLIVNAYFLLHWSYMLMSSINWNNSHYQKFIRFLGALLCLRVSSASLSIPRLPKRNRRLRNDEVHFRSKHKKKIRKAINKKNLEKILKQQKSKFRSPVLISYFY